MEKHIGIESTRFRDFKFVAYMAVILWRVIYLWTENQHRDCGMRNL